MTNAEIVKDLAVLLSKEKWEAIHNIASCVLSELKAEKVKEVISEEPTTEVEENVTSCATEEVANQEVAQEKPAKRSNGVTRKAKEEQEEIPAKFTKASLEVLSYNTLKKLASDMGISAKGSKPTLIESIIKETVTVPLTGDAVIPEEELTEEDKENSIELEAVPDEEEADDEEPTIAEEVEELTAEMSDEEIKEMLLSVGIKTRGKRQALIEAVIKAVEEGKLEFEDEESDEVEAESAEEENLDETEAEAGGDTPARQQALDELAEEVAEAVESGDLTREEMEEFINEYTGEEQDFSKVTDEELAVEYTEIQGLYIDDDGAFHENPKDEYLVRGELFCCGGAMTYDKKGKRYVCEVCDHTVKA